MGIDSIETPWVVEAVQQVGRIVCNPSQLYRLYYYLQVCASTRRLEKGVSLLTVHLPVCVAE